MKLVITYFSTLSEFSNGTNLEYINNRFLLLSIDETFVYTFPSRGFLTEAGTENKNAY